MSNDTKEKIIKAGMEIIGSDGVHAITMRKIAEKCGVNVAAINYHFGSKETLIRESLIYFARTMRSIFLKIDQSEYTPEEKLEKFIKLYSENMLRYPGVPKTIIGQIISEDNIVLDFFNIIKDGMRMIKGIISEATGIKDDRALSIRMAHMISGLQFPVIFGENMHILLDLDYTDNSTRKDYEKKILHDLLIIDSSK